VTAEARIVYAIREKLHQNLPKTNRIKLKFPVNLTLRYERRMKAPVWVLDCSLVRFCWPYYLGCSLRKKSKHKSQVESGNPKSPDARATNHLCLCLRPALYNKCADVALEKMSSERTPRRGDNSTVNEQISGPPTMASRKLQDSSFIWERETVGNQHSEREEGVRNAIQSPGLQALRSFSQAAN
jgi:hypothetical protein